MQVETLRVDKMISARGKIEAMSDTLHLRPDRVRRIANETIAAADVLTCIGRRQRLRLEPPAPDSISLGLTQRFNTQRMRAGLHAEAAADELTRIAEMILAYTYNMMTLALHTETAVMGLSAPTVRTTLVISARTSRDLFESSPPPDDRTSVSDDEILSFAVLLTAGRDPSPTVEPSAVGELRAAAEHLDELAEQLRAALSTGDRAATYLSRFSSWILTTYIPGLDQLEASVTLWLGEYARVRALLEGPAAEYRQWLAGALARQPLPLVDAEAARAEFFRYRAQTVPQYSLIPFPTLGGDDSGRFTP